MNMNNCRPTRESCLSAIELIRNSMRHTTYSAEELAKLNKTIKTLLALAGEYDESTK